LPLSGLGQASFFRYIFKPIFLNHHPEQVEEGRAGGSSGVESAHGDSILSNKAF